MLLISRKVVSDKPGTVQYDQPKYYAANIGGKLGIGYWEKDPNTVLQKTLKEYENMLHQSYVSQEDRISINAQ